EDRVLDRRTNSGPRRQVDDDADRPGREDLLDQGLVPDVSLDQGEAGASLQRFEVALLDLPRVELVEVVQDDDVEALPEEGLDQVGTDETRPSCNQDARHGAQSLLIFSRPAVTSRVALRVSSTLREWATM